ncbi:MAG: hypothetical protein KME32_25040 [Mojavia pulchra JT2-VF2]|uniref:Uncharacterized protein n=1 Tax=Mojavia pulchra JT2-VF2 TaxID=287848 RepID=A0A951UI98_9NOST|nr:hypothetical protein [Mojavia pulchra JT2-VF2]
MKKSKSSLSLGLVFMLLTSLIVVPTRANAGRLVNQGSSVDSSSSSGGSFRPRFNRSPNDPINQLIAPQEVQEHLNNIARKLTSNGPSPDNPDGLLAVLLLRGTNSCAAASQLQTAFENLGTSQASVKALINALSILYVSPLSTTPCLSVGSSNLMQLLASTKNLAGGTAIAQNSEIPKGQNSETPYVSIVQLNAAINAYNKIVLESSPETLQKLTKDPQFMEMSKFLKELRAAIKAWDESKR